MPQIFKAKLKQYGPVMGSSTSIFSGSMKEKREEASIKVALWDPRASLKALLHNGKFCKCGIYLPLSFSKPAQNFRDTSYDVLSPGYLPTVGEVENSCGYEGEGRGYAFGSAQS